jgi:adenosylcobinamide-GDP ribazoletransferase
VTRLVRPLVAAFAFLTRWPVSSGPILDVELGRSVAFFPVVGLVLGLVLSGLASLLVGALAPAVLAVALIALLAGMTGGLHIDGLADTFDALGGGRGDRQRMLDLMRDSRIGAHGAAALVLLLLVKVFALAELLSRHDLAAILVFPAVGRWAVTPSIVLHPYARDEGLGRAFSGAARGQEVAIASVVVAVMIAALGARLLLPALGALCAASLFALWLRRRLGGLTGDVYGATIELAEATTLVLAGAWPA